MNTVEPTDLDGLCGDHRWQRWSASMQ